MDYVTNLHFLLLYPSQCLPHGHFHPSSGIRKWDLLSPFLFIVMVEGLGQALKAALQKGLIKGLTFYDSITLSHQQFMNETILLNHPFVHEAKEIEAILDLFSKASSTSMNLAKSQIFFFNTTSITQRNIKCILRFSSTSLPSKCLGAPLTDSSIKHSS